MENRILTKIKTLSETNPNTLFFEDGKNKTTYLELENASNSLAFYLEKNFNDKRNILVYGEQDSRMVITFLGATKAGFCYVPVDAHTPKERLKMILEESQSICVVAISEWPLEGTNVPIINEEMFSHITKEINTPSLKYAVTDDDSYYTIFTSGTTGKPKGVQVTYNNLMSFCQWMLDDFHLKKEQRFLCQAPFSFDLSVMDLYPALLTGGTLVSLNKEQVNNFPVLFQKLPSMKLNVWVSTPSLIEICLLNPEFNAENLPTLENFQFCGEELPHVVARKLINRFPNAYIFNTYGPTEATVAVTSIAVTDGLLTENERIPLGISKKDTRILIMSNDKVLDANQTGEIVIVGPSVSKGYYNQELKTQEVFFTYENQPAYRTGDAGKLKDGVLYYKGRLDFQIKWHGYRMELGDIDHHLTSIDIVRNACVVPKFNKNNKVQQLIAYIVLKDSSNENTKELSKFLKKVLLETVMDYMIPQRFVFVESLPLTGNGKVDRKLLINEVNT